VRIPNITHILEVGSYQGGNNKAAVVLMVRLACKTRDKEVPVVFMTWCR